MKDANLRRCSAEEKGVWIDMLCLMFECDDRGVLASSGVAWSDKEIAQAIGGDLDVALRCVRSLVLKRVCDRNESGAIFSRRLVRDELNRRQNASRQAKFRNGESNAEVTHNITPLSEDEDEDEDEDRDQGKGGVGGKGKGYHADSRAALHLLNEATGSHFREVDANLSIISARLSEPGTTIEGIREMIERQCKLWKGTEMEKYLRPATLFGKEKFDNYYGAKHQPLPATNGAPRKLTQDELNAKAEKERRIRYIQSI
jgi:uncharacterized phage protein (TIGR02220 family)